MEDPQHIRCVNGHRLPDEAHPDTGNGYTDKTGKTFYLVGTYNSYIIDVLNSATTRLVHASALTGDTKYAHKAAIILDNLARIYPTSEKGSSDYPSNPPSGRFNRPWYQVARTLVIYVNQYDILLMSDELNQPSSNSGMTRRENIEKNMLLNGAAYCYRESVLDTALNNGEADYIRGPMAVGAAMGIPQYIAWGVDGPYSIRAMIANNVDRDGEYYETSAGYSDHARGLYMDMAEILQHYSDAAYPDGIHLADDPIFVMFNMLPRTRLRCATHPPSLGDDAPNITRIASTTPVDRLDLNNFERLMAMKDEGAAPLAADAFLRGIGDINKARESFPNPEWLLFHARDLSSKATATISSEGSDLFGQKGLAILRSGAGDHARAATLRFGPTLNHGHLDEMNLNIYAQGYEMSYDLGYSLGSTHTQVGWAHTTASHNTVVVDETPQLRAGRSGGSLQSFTSVPGVTVVRANDAACYQSQGVQQFDRTVAMIDIDENLSYLVDIFAIKGGKQHDYFFHALSADLTTEGLEFSAPAEGSLAGKDIHWGDKIGSDGNVFGVLGKDYWNPPPENGYGFLMHPRTAKVEGFSASPSERSSVWSATWAIARDHPANLRLNMLPTQHMDIVTCDAPGIYPKMPRAAYVVARRAGDSTELGSTFAAIIEPYGEKRGIKRITREQVELAGAVAARIELTDGRVDEIVWTPAGRFSVGRDGKTLVDVTGASVKGTIEKIDEQKNSLLVRMDGLIDKSVVGQFVHVSNPAYAQESPYQITSLSAAGNGLTAIGLAPTRLVLGQGHMDEGPPDGKTLPNVVPIEYAKSVARKSSSFFRGKRIATPDGKASTRIVDFDDKGMNITVESSQGFQAGDDLVIYDVGAGDSVRLPTFEQTPPTPAGDRKTGSNGGGKVGK
jgi:hypothetical protein